MSESRNGLRQTTDHEYGRMHADVVVGSYSPNGKQLRPTRATVNAEELAERQEMYASHAARVTGAETKKAEPPKKAPKGKRVKKVENEGLPIIDITSIVPQPTNALPPRVSLSKKVIYLHNQLGKIKMSVEAVLENKIAFCLVFATDDDLIFTPNPAETLNFIDQYGDTHQVYFADTIFDWMDKSKKLMILFRKDNE